MVATLGFGSVRASGAADALCPTQGGVAATVAAVEPSFDLRMSDGRLLRLAGFDPALRASRLKASPKASPEASPKASPRASDDNAHATLAALLVGHSLTAQILDSRADRWGRLPALVFAVDDARAGGMTARAIAEGLGRYNPEPAAHACRAAFVAAEQEARGASLGLWHDPSDAVLAADDRAALIERSSTIVLVEGRLTAVDAGPYRTKLRFAARDGTRRAALAATVLPRVVKSFEKQGVTFSSLIGRTLRLRGLLDTRFGPEIGLVGPDALEILPPDAPSTAASDIAGHG